MNCLKMCGRIVRAADFKEIHNIIMKTGSPVDVVTLSW